MKFIGLIFLSLVWGFNWVAIKISLEGLQPFTSASFRFCIAVLLLFFYIKFKGITLKIKRIDFWLIVVTGLLTYVFDYGLVYWGEQYLSAGVTSIFFSTFALFTALISNFILKSESFNKKKYIGIVIGFIGIVVIFFDQLLITDFNLTVILAIVAVIFAAFSAALATVISKKKLMHLNPEILSFYQLAVGILFLLSIAYIGEDIQYSRFSLGILLAVAYMGLMASAVAFVVYYRLLRQMSAITLSMMIYIIPLFAIIGDYVYYDQILSLRSFSGMALIFWGIWLSMERKKNKPAII